MGDEAASPIAPVARERDGGPSSIGRYVDLGEIAAGGMATVHFGRLTGHAGFAREVAIKRLHPHLASDPEFVAMLLDEARLAARVVHSNVVPTLDVVAEGADVFVVMEYVRGLPLSQLFKILRTRNERVPPRIASGIVIGMLHGLHAAHEATDDRGMRLEIVHRDVSPHNVLVGVDGVARILDFGIAKAEIRLQTTQDGRVKGKFAYMSPEQAQGGRVSRRTDVYAAGVVLWEALTGEQLYRGANELNVILKVMNGEVKPPSTIVPGLSNSVDAVVRKAMARDVDDRYATAREMATDLDRCLEGASAAEIGEWLARVGAPALQERTRRIAELEQAAASADTPPSSGRSSPGRRTGTPSDFAPLSRTRMSARPRSELTTIAEIATPLGLASTEAGAAEREGRGRWAVAMGSFVVAAFLLGLSFRVSHPTAEPLFPLSLSPATVHVPATAPDPTHEAPVTAGGEGSPASPTPPPPAAAPAGASTIVAPASSTVAPALAAPKHHKHPAECSPYTVDSAGHTHFNAACL